MLDEYTYTVHSRSRSFFNTCVLYWSLSLTCQHELLHPFILTSFFFSLLCFILHLPFSSSLSGSFCVSVCQEGCHSLHPELFHTILLTSLWCSMLFICPPVCCAAAAGDTASGACVWCSRLSEGMFSSSKSLFLCLSFSLIFFPSPSLPPVFGVEKQWHAGGCNDYSQTASFSLPVRLCGFVGSHWRPCLAPQLDRDQAAHGSTQRSHTDTEMHNFLWACSWTHTHTSKHTQSQTSAHIALRGQGCAQTGINSILSYKNQTLRCTSSPMSTTWSGPQHTSG